MDVLVTAGGTAEHIDAVRAITNTGTGRLGALIADRFAGEGWRVTHICSERAVAPSDPGIDVRRIVDTAGLEAAVRGACAETRFDAVVHSMAVSDFQVASVTSGGVQLDRSRKISSSEPELVVRLVPTTKVIGLFQTIAPQAVLVGFKLRIGTPKAELLEIARELLVKNRCQFVLANDQLLIDGDRHTGWLLSDTGEVAEFSTKVEIATGIFQAVRGRIEP
jgi:phosphopantothenate-cysteine ligase